MPDHSAASPVWGMLADRWRKSIKSKNLAPNTERTYLLTAARWATWVESNEPDLEPAGVKPHHVEDFISDVIETTSPSNGLHHYRNLRVFFTWLVRRDEMLLNPMTKCDPPRVSDKVIPILTNEDISRVLKVCSGTSFEDRRDTAIVLMFMDTGLRVSELHSLTVDDVELSRGEFQVRGKGGRIRRVGFGHSTGLALARYLRMRARKNPPHNALWVSSRGNRALRVDSIKAMLNRRGDQAGLDHRLHAHRFRHDFSHRWQDAGGSDAGLMAIAGWSSPKMARHYGRAAAEQRALAEQRRLSLADRLTD